MVLSELQWQNVPATIIRATHTGEDGFDIVIDSSRKAELQQALETAGAQPISEDTFEILRVEAGIARFGHRHG